jgi:predicted DNA-binding transcriptional regulator AlpA
VPATIAPPKFQEEVQRRLIDTFDLMLLLGLRSRASVWARVEAGKLPAPVINKERSVAFWDRDAITPLLEEQ